MSFTKIKYISKLSDSHVLVLGGTSGIGFCVAEACLEHGAHVIVSGSRQEKLCKALDRLKAAYPDASSRISGYTCDLSQPDQLEVNLSNLLSVVTTDRKLDHIAFTAGDALKITPVSEATPEVIRQTGNVRFLGALMLAKLAPKYLSPGPASSITLTGGSNTHKPMPGWTIIASYGAATEGMTRGLAVDLKPIRVNMVSPGAVHTELFADIAEDRLEDVLGMMRKATATGEVGRPEDVAEAYLYCMRDRLVTDSLIESNGGRLLV
ncbi:hypothetical protein BJ546DRAFT_520783 [Cryomyces antarcticus]|uniref:Uncharacterized protein n=1 Tax=Cryomyces antarcticus TaxID=329879 RepID=A0ABR0KST0_9PEZI|nr:hypothetical protein LTR39_002328 [Cryomyces antarcticus]KAK5016659.1 hypothetical protein LTR60_002303 [Cryomyces antarcticus]KAK5126198.1 hypothetical protein LTR16_003107 [Cryomyces antarcticus]